MKAIIPVILAGGSGTRLWPLSRKSNPKQFLKFFGNKSLFQQSTIRLTTSKKITFKPQITLTSSKFRFFITQQLFEIGVDPGPIIIEPEPKNTAPAILSATLYAYNQDKESILLVAPSDHLIPDIDKFHNAINLGFNKLQNGKIITFGIKPTHPETGYGYLELEELASNKVSNLVSFIEKPDIKSAENMIVNGNYLWNSGIFMFKAKDMIFAFKKYSSDIFYLVQEALNSAENDLGFIRLGAKAWSKCKNISIDYAVMEKTKNLSVVPFLSSWSDLGDWNTVWQKMMPDKNGVSKSTNAHDFNCENTLLRAEGENQVLIGLGLKNVIAIAMSDAVLVAHKDMVQDIKGLVDDIKLKKISQAENSTKDYRPWGWFESITISDYYQVKLIHVNPNASLSLQSHQFRSEHWIVVSGKARVTIDKLVKIVQENESIFVPKRSIHRIENIEKFPIVLIEVQIGSYLGEDDIVRYEDVYNRNEYKKFNL